MSEADVFADKAQLLADLEMIEISRWYRKEFVDRLVAASKSPDEDVLATLRLEATYQLAEFYYVLKARGIRTEEHIRRLSEGHNNYIAALTRDPEKMRRRVQMDLYYIEHWSLWMDLKILAKTPLVGFVNRNAF